MTSATTASGIVTRKTEPQSKCSSSAPDDERPERGDRAAERRPERDRLRPAGPDHSAVISASVVGYAMPAREPADDTGDEQHLVRGREAGQERQAGIESAMPRTSISLRP